MKYTKWKGVRNSDAGVISGGWLFVEFEKDTTILDIDPNVISPLPKSYKKGQKIGFQIRNVSNRREAILSFEKNRKILTPIN